MTEITTPPDAPSRSAPSTFSDRADAFVAWLETAVPDFNAVRSETNTFASNASTSESNAADSETAAVAAANFRGAWSGLTGALNIPASVSHSGSVWMLESNLADVTASEPGVSGDWVALAATTASPTFTGNTTFYEVTETVYSLTGTDVDPANGTVQTLALSANRTLTESLATGQAVRLLITGGNSWTITWPAGIEWVDGAAPTLTAKDIVTLEKIGADLIGYYGVGVA